MDGSWAMEKEIKAKLEEKDSIRIRILKKDKFRSTISKSTYFVVVRPK